MTLHEKRRIEIRKRHRQIRRKILTSIFVLMFTAIFTLTTLIYLIAG